VRPGPERSTHYFSCSFGTGTDTIKSVPGHVTLNLWFSSGGICGSHSAYWCVRDVNSDLLVELEDNSIRKDCQRSQPDYNRPEMLRLSN
jgi:hypothetical protein